MFTAGVYSSLLSGNIPLAVGYAIMKDSFTEKNKNNHKTENSNSEKIDIYSKHIKKPKYIKKTRTHTIPEDSERCISITKKGERCVCRKLQDCDYCVIHNKKLKPILIYEEKIVKEKPIRRKWYNLYGLLK